MKCFWVRLWLQLNTHLAHRAGEHQCSLGCTFLIVTFGFLLLCLFFGISLLRLNLLMPTCHFRTDKEEEKSGTENNLNFSPTLQSCVVINMRL